MAGEIKYLVGKSPSFVLLDEYTMSIKSPYKYIYLGPQSSDTIYLFVMDRCYFQDLYLAKALKINKCSGLNEA